MRWKLERDIYIRITVCIFSIQQIWQYFQKTYDKFIIEPNFILCCHSGSEMDRTGIWCSLDEIQIKSAKHHHLYIAFTSSCPQALALKVDHWHSGYKMSLHHHNVIVNIPMCLLNSYSKISVKFQEICYRCSWNIVSMRIRHRLSFKNLTLKAAESTKDIIIYHIWHAVLKCFHGLSLAFDTVIWSTKKVNMFFLAVALFAHPADTEQNVIYLESCLCPSDDSKSNIACH